MFRFNGTHARELGLRARSVSRPFMPPQKHIYESALDQDGSYDFSEFNSDGRIHFDDRIFEVEISLPALNMQDMQTKLSSVARWLVGGWCDLVFDDMPTTVWEAKLESVDSVTTLLRRIGRAVLFFRVKPFSKHMSGTMAQSWSTTEMTESKTITINNQGDWYTKPIIQAFGQFRSFKFGSFVLSFIPNTVQGLFIDFEKRTIKNESGVDLYDKINWYNSTLDFFELNPGVNQIPFFVTHGEFAGGQFNCFFDRLYFNEARV